MNRGLKALTVVIAAWMLSACGGTGFDAATLQPYDAADGANSRDSEVMVLNAVFVDNANGSATLSASFLNRTDSVQTLREVAAATLAGEELNIELAGPVTLAPNELYASGMKSADAVLNSDAIAGEVVRVVFVFDNAEDVELTLPLMARTSFWKQVKFAGELVN